jgi:hypothetical protein
MNTIHKFKIEIVDEQVIEIDPFAKILSFQVQNGEAFIWALVNSNNVKVPYRFAIVGTGNPFIYDKSDARFIGTVQLNGFVWHLFQI